MSQARAEGAGPDTPDPVKREVALALHSNGCTWGDIGGLFGLSTEAVRQMAAGRTTRALTETEWEIIRLLRRLEGSGDAMTPHRVVQQLRVAEQASGMFLGRGA